MVPGAMVLALIGSVAENTGMITSRVRTVPAAVLVSLVAFILTLGPGSAGSLAALPLEEVTLYTSGVGEFVHRGPVTGSGMLSISVPAASMSDVLRSVTVLDQDGGTVEALSFATGETVDTRLGRFAVDLTATHRLHHVLRQLRGATADVTVSVPYEMAPGAEADRTAETDRGAETDRDGAGFSAISGSRTRVVSGVLVGAEENTLLIAREEGLREIPLWQVEDVNFTDPRAREEFRSALAALSGAALESDSRELVIRYAGSGRRTLEVRYLQEVPRWHTTYRAVIGSGASRALLQGWAHLDNTTSVDWDSVRLTLVSAQPVTYRFDLYEPRYVERPPFVQEDALDPTAPPAVARTRTAPAPEALMMQRMEFDVTAESSVRPGMVAEELMTGMTFSVPDRISVPRGRSTMVPLVNRPLSVSMTRYFDPRRDGRQPRAAFHLTNDGVVQLPAGPVTVYEGNRYVGDGAITTLLPGASTVVTYARDSDLLVTTVTDTGEEELVTVRIVEGILQAEHRARHTTTYRVQASTGSLPGRNGAAPLVVSHPLRGGWELVSPLGADIQGQTARITVTGSGETVVEERIRSQRYTLATMEDSLLVSFSSNRLIDPTVRRTLQNISTLRGSLAEHQRRRRALESRRDQLFADQQRISANMAQLDRESALYRRYATDLNQQENELQQLRRELEDVTREEQQAERALREYLRTL
ncbi:MAG: DUF4139 domain-containing protein [Spirochaetaceae bacterium]|nr:MAG: DUF4139 domain-containing protein [Spirochaetaceae bacterium]